MPLLSTHGPWAGAERPAPMTRPPSFSIQLISLDFSRLWVAPGRTTADKNSTSDNLQNFYDIFIPGRYWTTLK
jgi:hypothetical protein